MDTYFKRVQKETPSRFWINNVTRKEAKLAINAGAVGCTQNPSYVWKMINSDDEKKYVDNLILEIIEKTNDDNEVVKILQQKLIANTALIFNNIYEKSAGDFGFVSIQGDPFDESSESILSQAHENIKIAKNIMIKIPVTEEGLKAIRKCISEGIPVNATEVMSLSQAINVLDIFDEETKNMKNPPKVFISHIAGIFDEYILKSVKTNKINISSDYLFQAGKIIAKKIRDEMDSRATKVGFINGGARGLHHVTEWIGSNISTTINWKGTAEELIKIDPPVVCRFDNPIPYHVIDSLVLNVPEFYSAYFPNGLKPSEYEDYGPVILFCSSFKTAWKSSIEYVSEKRKKV